jgi:hypothetical protein
MKGTTIGLLPIYRCRDDLVLVIVVEGVPSKIPMSTVYDVFTVWIALESHACAR